MASETPLLRFIRALNARVRGPNGVLENEKEKFASEVGTPLLYLYQLAAQKRPNPTLQIAHAIVERSKVWGPRVMAKPLTYEDLLVGAVDDSAPGSDASGGGRDLSGAEAERGEAAVSPAPRRARRKTT